MRTHSPLHRTWKLASLTIFATTTLFAASPATNAFPPVSATICSDLPVTLTSDNRAASIATCADRLSTAYRVPSVVIKAMLEQESQWLESSSHEETGTICGDGSTKTGYGLMEITMCPEDYAAVPLASIDFSQWDGENEFHTRVSNWAVDMNLVKTDWRYNIEIGIRYLLFKRVAAKRQGYDANIVENWYYPFAYYNGTTGNDPNDTFLRKAGAPSDDKYKNRLIFPYQECIYNIIAQLYYDVAHVSWFGPRIQATLPGPLAVYNGSAASPYVADSWGFYDEARFSRNGKVALGNGSTTVLADGTFPKPGVVHAIDFGSPAPDVVITPIDADQYNGTTRIPLGGTLNGSTVTFRAKLVIERPVSELVKLEVELLRVDEWDGTWPTDAQAGAAIHVSAPVPSGTTAELSVFGLIPAAYRWRARMVDGAGNRSLWESYGNNKPAEADFVIPSSSCSAAAGLSVATASCPVLPAVSGATASSVGETTANLNASVTPNGLATVAWFELQSAGGLTSRTAPAALGTSGTPQPLTASVAGLDCGTLYTVTAAASNAGGTQYGTSASFTTSACSALQPLSVTRSGSGSGSVSAVSVGIACPSTCFAVVAPNTSVTLTAMAAAGSTFTGWGGDCSGAGTCTVTMSQPRNVIATFATTPPPAGTWVSISPAWASGRMSSIAPHPTIAGTLYAAADGGGVWKTTDGGATWQPIADSAALLSIGAVAVAPSQPGTIYAGTGGRNNTFGIGMLKSTDGGATWALVSSVGRTFFRISVHPSNPNELVAISGDGGYRSTDGGVSWTNVIPSSDLPQDLVRDPSNPSILYASLTRCWTCAPTVKKSSDGGVTWIEKSSGLPTVTRPSGSYVGRIALAIDPVAPSTLYAAAPIIGTSSNVATSHIYRTTNGGDSWTELTGLGSSSATSGYNGWGNVVSYANFIAVSPANHNVVIAGGLYYVMSKDGGATWQVVGNELHADCADLQYQGSTLYVANDGGMWKSTDDGAHFTSCNNGLVTRQYFGLDADDSGTGRMLVGGPDNGTDLRQSASNASWTNAFSGDGADCVIDRFFPSIGYLVAIDYTATTFRLSDLGASPPAWSNVTPPFAAEDSGSYGGILRQDPSHPGRLYAASYRMWRSDDGADSWQALPTTTTDGSVWSSLWIEAFAVAPSNGNVLMVAKVNTTPNVYRSTDGGVTWRGAGTGLPWPPGSLEIDPHDANVAYAAAGQFTGFTSIYSTTDGGATWQPLGTTGLPTTELRVVRVDPTSSTTLYCGTSTGVYVSTDRGSTWSRLGTGMPNVTVIGLEISGDGNIVRAATDGRGLWEIRVRTSANHAPIAAITAPASPATVGEGTNVLFTGTIADPDSGDTVTAQWTTSDGWVSAAATGSTPSFTHQFSRAGTYWVSLTARDSHGAQSSASVMVSVVAACTAFSVTPSSVNPDAQAGSQMVVILPTAPAGCAGGSWSAAGNGSWITVSPTSGSGPAIVTVSWMQNGGAARSGVATIAGNPFSVTQSAAAGPSVFADFNGDARSDIFWRNASTGQVSVWMMNGVTPTFVVLPMSVPAAWNPTALGDFDADRGADIFWQNASTGETSVWVGWNGTTFGAWGTILTVSTSWKAMSAGDIDGNGTSDLFWYNTATGETGIWFMNGMTYSAMASTTTVPTAWAPAVVGDFDGDGKADIFWRNGATGETAIWLGWNGSSFATQVRSLTIPTAWKPVGAGDGKSDIFWFNQTTGETSIWFMNGTTFSSAVRSTTVPTAWKPVWFGDFDGDGTTDIFWRNGATGETAFWLGWNGSGWSTQVRSFTVPPEWVTVPSP